MDRLSSSASIAATRPHSHSVKQTARRSTNFETRMKALLDDSHQIADAVLGAVSNPAKINSFELPDLQSHQLETHATNIHSDISVDHLQSHLRPLVNETDQVLELLSKSQAQPSQLVTSKPAKNHQGSVSDIAQSSANASADANNSTTTQARRFRSVSSTRQSLGPLIKAASPPDDSLYEVSLSAILPPAPEPLHRITLQERSALCSSEQHVPNILKQNYTLSSSGLATTVRHSGKYLQGYSARGIPDTLRPVVLDHPEVADFQLRIPPAMLRRRGVGEPEPQHHSTAHNTHLPPTEQFQIGPQIVYHGKCGNVHVGRDVQCGRHVVIKAVSRQMFAGINPSHLIAQRLRLSHECIAKMIDVVQVDSGVWFVSEMLTGGDLLDRITSHSHYTENTVKAIAKSMLAAVMHLHKNKFVHGSIGPQSFVFESNKSHAQLKLTFNNFAFSNNVKVHRGIYGDLEFAPPEVLKASLNGEEPMLVGSADVWAIGVIIHLLMTGCVPFNGTDEDTLYRQIKAHKGVLPELQHVSGDAASFVASLLSAEPHMRPQASVALRHAWLSSDHSAPPLDCLDQLRQWNDKRHFVWDMVNMNVPIPAPLSDSDGQGETADSFATSNILRAWQEQRAFVEQIHLFIEQSQPHMHNHEQDTHDGTSRLRHPLVHNLVK